IVLRRFGSQSRAMPPLWRWSGSAWTGRFHYQSTSHLQVPSISTCGMSIPPNRIRTSTTKKGMSLTNKEDIHEGETHIQDPRPDPGASPRTGDRPYSEPEKLAPSPGQATTGDAVRAGRGRLCRRVAGAC